MRWTEFNEAEAAISFEGAYRKGWYDVAPDGCFVMIERAVPPPARINVVFNWVEELKRLVPTN